MKHYDKMGALRAALLGRSRPLLLPFLGTACLTAATAAEVDLSKLPPAANRRVEFARDIRPIFEKSCHACHGPEKQKADYRLDSKAAALKGGESHVPAIKLGDSAGSPLIHLVAGLVPETRMPAKGDPLTSEQIGLLRAWIDQGAHWSDEGRAEVDPIKSHWAFNPVIRPDMPRTTHHAPRTTSPIDSFITAKLAERKLKPSPDADRVTLIRRLYFVMLGMPPTPDEVTAFLDDKKPNAFERLVDMVLDDPRYGERWGRHWLDVIRFAESNGFETNRERPNAWRFRDYVIAALNSDKPYDQFIREQLAGDALGMDVATGFLVGGPVDIVGSPDPVLTAQQRADELDDMVSTTSTAFLGLTLGCARCHSHKFDPIAHREYYAMAALFTGVKHGERALPMPEEQKRKVTKLEGSINGLEQRLARFIPQAATANTNASSGTNSLRPPVNAVQNEELFSPIEAQFVRFTVLASSSGEPCLDELEVWSAGRNVALAANGTRTTASGTLPGYEIHKLEHINDGRVGNGRSWISSEAGRGWVQLEFPRIERVERIVWSRDREGKFGDRIAASYRIEAAREADQWKLVTSSDDREPFKGKTGKPTDPTYRFDGFPATDAQQARKWLAELDQARKERNTLAKTPMVYAGTFTQPGPTHRLHRGDPMQKRESVAPGTLEVFKPLNLATNAPEQDRRLKLAEWIASPENPLTARVLVNRVWQYHFGVGLVDTPNDFGKNGSRPTHPELLDWLASELMQPRAASFSPSPGAAGEASAQDKSKSDRGEGGPNQSRSANSPRASRPTPHAWSVKHLHRLILTSATWRQSSAPRADAVKVDASSRLLWRFPPRRLEAEAIRDSILAVSGNLDPTAGGPAFFLHNVDRENVYHYHPKETFNSAETRRMVYALKVRMEQDGVFGAFDCPDGSLVMPRRNVSTTPLQALNLFNSGFILQQSEIFARRLEKEVGTDIAAQIRRAWQLAFNRPPERKEAREAIAFAKSEGMPALCRAVLNANEFLFIP